MNNIPVQMEILSLLARLGTASNHIGMQQTAYGVYLAVQNPNKLTFTTKWLYPEIAKYYGTNWNAVERNIRSVTHKIWETNPQLLSEIAGRKLLKKPTASNLMVMLTYYFLDSLDAA